MLQRRTSMKITSKNNKFTSNSKEKVKNTPLNNKQPPLKEQLPQEQHSAFLLIHKGLESIALQELEELKGIKGTAFPGEKDFSVIEFFANSLEDLTYLLNHLQSIRGLFLSVGYETSWKNFLTKDFHGSKFLFNQASFKIEIEGVSDLEERKEITSSLAGKIFDDYNHLDLKVDFKKAQVVALICSIGSNYFFGWDLSGQELHKRSFRVFPHQASFTGDIAYYLVRKVGFNKSNENSKLLVGLAKDSSIALEAAVFLHHKKLYRTSYLLEKYPIFQKLALSSSSETTTESLEHSTTESAPDSDNNQLHIFAFDESNPNYVASRKNIKIAGLSTTIDLNKYSLDELELKYGDNIFRWAIFHFTSKDEEKINEVYYQLNLILKKSGQVLFVCRKNWDLPISDRFELLEKEELTRGESTLNLWLLRKK